MNDSKHTPPDDSGGSSPSGHDGVNHQVCQSLRRTPGLIVSTGLIVASRAASG